MIVTSGTPPVDQPVPAAVRRLVGDEVLEPVWRNELGGLTFRLPASGRFVKWSPPDTSLDLAVEAERLRWAVRFVTVPRVLGLHRYDDGDVLVTAAVPGRSAVDPLWIAQPRAAVRALGIGLRRLHETLPVTDCPFAWSAYDRAADARSRHGAALVGQPPPVDRLVVCHGDACAPNTLLADDGGVSGHVDLGRLGVGDRWADLAVATWSTEWNYGPGWEHELLDAYDVGHDATRTDYYRRLWELGP